jgi:putative ABC transport system permease protein
MNTVEAIRIALQSLWANKLRSVLTLLGVVIGVAAVIAVVTFVNGINGYVSEKIFNLGADVFILSKAPNVITNADQYLESLRRKEITLEDYEAVAAGCSACKFVGAMTTASNASVKYSEESSADSWARGWTPSIGPIYDLDLASGRSITESDLSAASNVVVIGHDIQENLMGGVDPLGKEIRVDGHLYQVVGVATAKGKTLGMSMDNWVVMPITTWLKQYGSRRVDLRVWAKAYGAGTGCGDRPVEGYPAGAAARRRGPAGQFRGGDQSEFSFHLGGLEQHVFRGHDCHRLDCAGGGRHRDHEHHAGVGHRAHPRDRHPQGPGSAARRRDAAVSDRVGHDGVGGRHSGRHRGGCGGKNRNPVDRHAFGD